MFVSCRRDCEQEEVGYSKGAGKSVGGVHHRSTQLFRASRLGVISPSPGWRFMHMQQVKCFLWSTLSVVKKHLS